MSLLSSLSSLLFSIFLLGKALWRPWGPQERPQEPPQGNPLAVASGAASQVVDSQSVMHC